MFSIQSKKENGFKKIVLKDNNSGTTAEIIPKCAAILHAFKIKNNKETINVIKSYSSLEGFKNNVTKKGYRGCKLSPFVCRINKRTYWFGKKEYVIEKNPDLKHALHGELYDKEFTIISQTANEEFAAASMKYSYNKEDKGYPFQYDCIVTWKLESENRLTVTTECINKDEGLIPIQDGWHPYFTFGGPINDLHLEFQSMEMVEFNKDLVPTGKLTEYDEFNSFKKIGSTFLDNCFSLNPKTSQPICALRDVQKNIQVEFHPSVSYPYLQIYTPPDRESIAIENISGTPDGFNNNSFQTLEPGQSSIYNVTYKVTLLNKAHE